jgi:chemotaxis signal transduction protein
VLSVGAILGAGIAGGSYLILLEGAAFPFALVATEIDGVERLPEDAIRLPRAGDGSAARALGRAVACARGEDFAVLNLQRLADHLWPAHSRAGAH